MGTVRLAIAPQVVDRAAARRAALVGEAPAGSVGRAAQIGRDLAGDEVEQSVHTSDVPARRRRNPGPAPHNHAVAPTRTDLRHRIGTAIAERVSPERTRAATLTERLTVSRLSWDWLVRANRWLGLLGKFTTGLWCGFVAAVILGFDVERVVRDALNSGQPIREAFVLAILLPTIAFLLARSAIGYARWRLQRELWRRDVERLSTLRRDDEM